MKGFNKGERNNPPRSSRAILTERRQILTEVSFPPLCWQQGEKEGVYLFIRDGDGTNGEHAEIFGLWKRQENGKLVV